MHPISLLRRLKARLHARPDSEHEQAGLRIVIVGLILAYMALFHGAPSRWSATDLTIVLMLSGFFAVAVGIFVAICIWPASNVPRRLLGMLADNAGATWYMAMAGEYGYSMLGVFLFVTFGNGFRYGRRYLFGSQALCLVGYIGVIAFVPFWQGHRTAGIGLLIALIVLPYYVATLLERIQDALAKAEEANLAKTSFLANMSHEMRTPLNGIVGIVDLLRTTPLSIQQGEMVSLLRHSISVLRSLVDDVLDISKIEAGRLTLEVAPFDLHVSINGLMHLLSPHASSKGLALHAVVDPAIEYRLKGDSHHLRQILLNLLGNAIKFTERGEVTLAVSQVRDTAEGTTVRFEVRDSGIGIAPEALSKIFERFVQADQSTTRKYGGTGLGTTIAKQLAELMGGAIGVESTLGQGSTFWVELPFLKDTSAVEASVPPASATEADRPLPASREIGLTVVLASAALGQVTATLREIGQPYEIVTPLNPLGIRLDELIRSNVTIRAIVAACDIDQACSAFAAAAQRLPDKNVAYIYVATGELSVVDKARVNSIKGAFALQEATPRLISNAIHAATAGNEQSRSVAGDLASELKRERTSLKVLVAEDNPTNQRIIRQLLESAGHEVVLAGDGEEALDLYELEEPDLAILDFNMPQRSGIEVIQAIRMMEPPGTRMPTLILSASVTTEARDRARQAGADQFVGKPFDAASLISEVDRLGERTPRARRNAVARPEIAGTESAQPRASRRSPPANSGSGARGSNRGPGVATTESERELLDPARLAQLEDIARDPSFLTELIHGFFGDVDTILAGTRHCISTSRKSDIPDLMHSLKGAAVGVGATRLAALAVDLESSGQTLSAAGLESKLESIVACFDATSASLKSYLQSNHRVPT
ncbi:MAG: ATP-binding protein [Candidatus Levyibacteriota bacterium]